MKTGTHWFWMMGLTVVGNPAARVITSSPGLSLRSPSLGEVKAEKATRLADDPEFTNEQPRTPRNLAKRRSNSFANLPVVSQQSSAASTKFRKSLPLKTLPETGTTDSPATNARFGNCSSKYSSERLRICSRSWEALLLIQ